MINQNTITPIGHGVIQGLYAIVQSGERIVSGVMVRLEVNDETRKHLSKSNCITPRANKTGLWVFKEEELNSESSKTKTSKTSKRRKK